MGHRDPLAKGTLWKCLQGESAASKLLVAARHARFLRRPDHGEDVGEVAQGLAGLRLVLVALAQNVVGVSVPLDVRRSWKALVPNFAEVVPVLLGLDSEHRFVWSRTLDHRLRVVAYIGLRIRSTHSSESTFLIKTAPSRWKVATSSSVTGRRGSFDMIIWIPLGRRVAGLHESAMFFEPAM